MNLIDESPMSFKRKPATRPLGYVDIRAFAASRKTLF